MLRCDVILHAVMKIDQRVLRDSGCYLDAIWEGVLCTGFRIQPLSSFVVGCRKLNKGRTQLPYIPLHICVLKETCRPNIGAQLSDVMSQSELTTQLLQLFYIHEVNDHDYVVNMNVVNLRFDHLDYPTQGNDNSHHLKTFFLQLLKV